MPLCGERPSLSDLLWFRWGHWLYLTMSSRQSVKYLGEWILPPVLWGPRWAPLWPFSALSLSLLAHRFLLAGASHSPSIVLGDGHYGVWAHSVTGATGVTSRAGERVSPAWYKWLTPLLAAQPQLCQRIITYSRPYTTKTITVRHIRCSTCQRVNVLSSALRGHGQVAALAAIVRLSAGSGLCSCMTLLLIHGPLVYSPGRKNSTAYKSGGFFFLPLLLLFSQRLAHNSF